MTATQSTRTLIMSALLASTAAAHANDPRDRLPVCDTKTQKSDAFCKCYGAALKGYNDCSNKAGTHSCGGASQVDCDPGEYKVVKALQCESEQMLCLKNKDKPKGFWQTLKDLLR
jgi:uncharacterized membrane protein